MVKTKYFFHSLFFLFILSSLSACKVYKQNIILSSEQDVNIEEFRNQVQKAEQGYLIKPFDRLRIEVYSDQGERIIDPFNPSENSAGINQVQPDNTFQVFADSTLNLPLIGSIKLSKQENINTLQNRLLEAYSSFYKSPYVRVTTVNRRVIVLGALGGQVITLENESMNLLEVLALSGGLNNNSKGSNIRIIRGPLENPSVQLINLSTIEGMKKANLAVIPGDVIYIEPVRRVFSEGFRDAAPVIGVITNLITLIIVSQNLF